VQRVRCEITPVLVLEGLLLDSEVAGSLVDLQLVAASDSTFTGWSGACSGDGLCQVAVTGHKSLTASFDPLPACGSNAVIINSTDFTGPGHEVKSAIAIITRGIVTIAPNADLTLRAPTTGLEPGFATELLGQLAIFSENPGCGDVP